MSNNFTADIVDYIMVNVILRLVITNKQIAFNLLFMRRITMNYAKMLEDIIEVSQLSLRQISKRCEDLNQKYPLLFTT